MDTPTLEALLRYMNEGKPLRVGTGFYSLMRHYSEEARKITSEINSSWHEPAEVRRLMAELTGTEIDESFRLFPPFYSDFGKNIHIGRKVFINSCCCFQDQGGIYVGDNALIGHKVVIATINHGFSPEDRTTNYLASVRIGRNVWIGAGATLLPGVTIGDNAVIAAGAVVTRDVEGGTIVAGVPAKFLKRVPA